MKVGKNRQVVLRLIDAASDNDKERILSFLADEMLLMEQATAAESPVGFWSLLARVHSKADDVVWLVDTLYEQDCGSVETMGLLRYSVDGSWQEARVDGRFLVRGSNIHDWHDSPG